MGVWGRVSATTNVSIYNLSLLLPKQSSLHIRVVHDIKCSSCVCVCVCVCVSSVCSRLISHSLSVSSMCCLWQIRCAPAHKLEAKCTVFGLCVQEVVKALLTEKSSSPLTRKVQSVCSPKSPFVPRQGLIPTALEVYWPQERESNKERDREPLSLVTWEPMHICLLYLKGISQRLFFKVSTTVLGQIDSASVQAYV